MHRRALLTGSLTALAGYALLREVRVLAGDLDSRLDARRWIARQDELARGLADGTITPRAWHASSA